MADPKRSVPTPAVAPALANTHEILSSSAALLEPDPFFFPGRLLAEDIVIGMSAAFTGPSRALGIELYRDVPNIGREQTCGGDAAGL